MKVTPNIHDHIRKYYVIYLKFKEDMQSIEDRWCQCMIEISEHRETLSKKDSKFIERNNRMMEEHKKILQTNFWLTRTLEQKLVQDMSEFDAQIILLVGDTTNIAEKLLNWKGHCVCEECMLVEYGESVNY